MPSNTLLETSVELDVLVALGKNIGIGSSPEDIRAAEDHLSPESRMIARAAGYLCSRSPGVTLLFSTGQTAGEDTPAESDAMWDYTRQRFPNLPPAIRERRSLNTSENAEEVAKLLIERGLHAKRIGLLTVGYHEEAAVRLFEGRGVNIEQSFAAEDVLIEYEPNSRDEIEAWARSRQVKLEKAKEGIRLVLLSTIDRKGKMLSWVTERTRG